MPFDPNKPFEKIESSTGKFDPSKPFEKAESDVKEGSILEKANAAAMGLVQGGTFGLYDEAVGALGALGRKLKGETEGQSLRDIQQEISSGIRQGAKELQEASPKVYKTAEVASAIASPITKALAPVKGATLAQSALSAAKAGGLAGLGYSEADLIKTLKGDVKEGEEIAYDVGIPAAFGAGVTGVIGGAPVASKKIIQKATGLAKRLREASTKSHSKVVNDVKDLMSSIEKTPGITADGVKTNLIQMGNEFQEVVLPKVYNQVDDATGSAKIVDMNKLVTRMRRAISKLDKKDSDVSDYLIKETNKLSKKIDAGRTPRFQNMNEAWDTIQEYGRNAKFDTSLSNSANTAKVIKRGIMRKVMDASARKNVGRELTNTLKSANKAASENMRAQALFEGMVDKTMSYTPSIREAIMLGMGGLGKGTMGTVGAISFGSKVVPALSFSAARVADKGSRALGLNLPRARQLGTLASFGVAKD